MVAAPSDFRSVDVQTEDVAEEFAEMMTPEPGTDAEPSCSVLICEDESLTMMRLRSTLIRQGFHPIGSASTGTEAVELAQSLRPDVILMDVQMPGLNGIEAVERIMSTAPTVIVMLTAHGDEVTVQRALTAGASGYLVKPLRDNQLGPTLSVARRSFAEQIAERERRRAQSEAADRRREVEQQRVVELEEELARQRELARRLAESFFSPTPEIPGLRIETCYEPAYRAELIGGDYYDFLQLTDGRLGFVIADVCGKGLAAAALTAVIRHTLRAYALEDPAPARVLQRLNRAICLHTTDECAFVTLVYGVLDLSTYELVYANAGHPEPVVGTSIDGEAIILETTGGMLGFIPEWEWTEGQSRIPPGGALVLYTDGVAEARRGRDFLGVEGVTEAVTDLLREGADQLADGLRERAYAFAGGTIRDDLTIVVLRRLQEPVPT